MKYVKCEFYKVALAALILGVFSLNPFAHADVAVEPSGGNPDMTLNADGSIPTEDAAPADEEESADSIDWDSSLVEAEQVGMSLGQIRKISKTFGMKIKDGQLVFSGNIPASCTNNARAEFDTSESGTIRLTVDFPDCRNGVPEDDNSGMVAVSSAIDPLDLDADGNICLLVKPNSMDDGECKPVNGPGGVQLSFKTSRTIQQESEYRAVDALVNKVEMLCKKGDFQQISNEVEGLGEVIGDVTDLLDKIELAKQAREQKEYKNAISKARDADEARDAFATYLDKASSAGWDTEKVAASFVSKQFDLLQEILKDGELSTSDKVSAIQNFEADAKENGLKKDNKKNVLWAYSELASGLQEEGNYAAAEQYFTKAISYANKEEIVTLESTMAKMYSDAYQACLEEAGMKVGKCDKLAKAIKKHTDKAITAQGKIKGGDDSLEALAMMKQERIQMFGAANYKYSVPGYGIYNPYGGSLDAAKAQMYQQSLQQMMQQQQMQQQMGQMGMQPGGGEGGGGFFH